MISFKSHKTRKILEILLLALPVLIYGWFFWHYFSMRPDPNDPIEYIEPSVWRTFIGGYYPWLDRLMIADSIRALSFLFKPELAGAVYFGLVTFAILAVATVWSYLKKGFWAAFLVGLFLSISFPIVRYANYGYPDATVALWGLIALIFFLSGRPKAKTIFFCGVFTAFAVTSKVTGLAFLIYFIFDILIKRRFNDLKFYLFGLFSALGAVLLLTGLLFDFASVRYVFKELGSNVLNNTAPREVIRSIGNVLFPAVWFPAYAALLFFRKAYRDSSIRPIYLASLAFIGFFVVLTLLSRHVRVYPHYLYSASVLASIGTAWYLARLAPKKTVLSAILISALGLIGTSAGILLATNFAGLFSLNISWFLIIGYIFFGVLGLLLLTLVEKWQRPTLALILICYNALFGSFFVTGSAYATIKAQKSEIALIYSYAGQIAAAPKGKVVIHGNLSADEQAKILWVYSTFFDQKYDRSSPQANLSEIKQNVEFQP